MIRYTTWTLLLAAAIGSNAAFAQGTRYPDRPIRLVIPFTPGGGTDIVGRLLATRLSADFGQPVVIENVPGANGLVARQQVACQPADGHVLMLGSNSTHAIAPITARESLADLQRDFAPVTIIAETTLALAVSPASPLKTLRQYLDASRAKPLTFGTFGQASSAHLMGELLSLSAAAPMLHVPYKGSAPAVADVMGEHIDSVFLTVAAVSAQVNSGKLRALAVTGQQRIAALPEVPTFAEAGVKGLENAGWFALFAPGATPAPVRERVAASVAKIVVEPESQRRLIELGLQPVGSTPERHRTVWDATLKLVDLIVAKTGLKLN